MRKWIVMLVIALYGPFIVNALGFLSGDVASSIILASIGLSIVFIMINICYAAIGTKTGLVLENLRQWGFWAVGLKLVLIPFFVLNIILMFGIGIVSLHPFFFILALYIPIAMTYLFSVFVVTSAYTLRLVGGHYKNKTFGLAAAVIHAVLQCIFIIDLIDLLYLVLRYNILAKPKNNG